MANENRVIQSALLSQAAESAVQNTFEKYAVARNQHTVGGSNEDRAATKEQYIRERRHAEQLKHEAELFELQSNRLEAEKSNEVERVARINEEIRQKRLDGPTEIGFDYDELSKNFSSTFEEIATNFSDLTRAKQKAELLRLENLREMIQDSNAVEKEFLVAQLDRIQTTAQKEYNKRATLAARATESAAELAEQYLDLNSLYSGFVDHNPVMMALWRVGSDFIRRWRVSKKAQRESIVRDKANAIAAEEQNKRNELRGEREAKREEELFVVRHETAKVQNEIGDVHRERKSVEKEFKKSGGSAESTPPTFERDPVKPTDFSPEDGGDDALTGEFLNDLFGSHDEEGNELNFDANTIEGVDFAPSIDDAPDQPDPPTFERDHSPAQQSENRVEEGNELNFDANNIEGVDYTPDQPEPPTFERDHSPAQQSENRVEEMFARQEDADDDRNSESYRTEHLAHQEGIFARLGEISDTLSEMKKISEDNGEKLDKANGASLLEMGLIAKIFSGPVLKALMLIGPAIGVLSSLLGKLGLSAIGDKLSGGFDGMVDKFGGDKHEAKTRRDKGKNFARDTKGKVKDKVGRAARGTKNFVKAGASRGAGALSRVGGMAARGAGALLGSTAGGIMATGAAGYGVGSLINATLPDETKAGIGDTIGPKIDSVLSFFGNDATQERQKMLEQQVGRNSNTLGLEVKSGDDPEEVPNTIMKREPSGSQLVVSAEKIESNRIVNNQAKPSPVVSGEVEIPMQLGTEKRLVDLERKVVEYTEVKEAAMRPHPVKLPDLPRRGTQKVVKSEATPPTLTQSRTARNPDSSIQRLTDRMVGYSLS